MAKYNVIMPIAGYVEIEVEADSEQEAIEYVLENGYDGASYEEVEPYESINTGNFSNLPYTKASVELIEEDEE